MYCYSETRHDWMRIGVICVALIGILAGCGARNRSAKEISLGQHRVRRVSVEGNTVLDDSELTDYLHIRPGDMVSADFGDRMLDPIVEVYAAKGYHRTRIVKVDRTLNRRNDLEIVIHVHEGEPVRVTRMEVQWSAPIPERLQIERDLPLKEGAVADVGRFNATVTEIRKRLKGAGYALSTVSESMDVYLEDNTATARFDIAPGSKCRVGHIVIRGLEEVPEVYVRRALEGYRGQVFTTDLQKNMETTLMDMNVFSTAQVMPAATENTGEILDVDVILNESAFQRLRVGFGVQYESNRSMAWTRGEYSHSNLFNRLNHFRLRTNVGWAVVPALWDIERNGPVILVEPSLTRKGLIEKDLVWNIGARYLMDVEEDYELIRPSISPSVSRRFGDRLFIKLGYDFAYFFLRGLNNDYIATFRRMTGDLPNPVRLAHVSVTSRLMFTDQVMDPNNGVVVKHTYSFSGKPVASQVEYNKFEPSLSLYWRLVSWLQVALRGEMGLLLPLGETESTSVESNFFLGGHDTVRGFGRKKLAPYLRICPFEETPDRCKVMHQGGRTLVLGNAELRFRLNRFVDVVTFLDVGDVQYGVMTVRADDWNYATGSGIRINTPVGKFRMDVGIRINNPDVYDREPRWAVHLGLGEAF